MKALDLFAGAGGWTTGARNAGVNVVCAVNHWPRAIDTHRANHPETEHRCEDVAATNASTIPDVDLGIASPSCTGHARARGKERPAHDVARMTAWGVLHVFEMKRPRRILIENVPEFAKWALFPSWRDALQRMGYRLTFNTLNAADFGVPQERVRLIISGRLGRALPAISTPAMPRHVPAAEIIDWHDGRWSEVRKKGRAAATIARWRHGLKHHGQRFVASFYGNTTTARSIERPIGTITTKDRWGVFDGERMRMLSVTEAKRAMSFPADYVLTGNREEQMKQLGNAVPPLLAEHVIRQTLEAA